MNILRVTMNITESEEAKKNRSLKQYLYTLTPEIVDLINEKKNSNKNEQKIQLIMAVNFRHTTDHSIRTFHIKSDNVEITQGSKTNDIMTNLLESFLTRYEQKENILRNGSDYSFECVDMTGIHFHNIKLKRRSSYINSPKWILDKNATINPKSLKDNNCFQYPIIAALHHQEINDHPDRITKLKSFINNYNCKDIDFPAGSKEYKIFERNNKDIALNILSVPPNEKEINIIYKSDHNYTREKQVVLLMIIENEEEYIENGWHYIAVKSVSRLFRGITSNHKF